MFGEHGVETVLINYEEFRKVHAEHFNFKIINGMFASFAAVLSEGGPPSYPAVICHRYDKLVYRADAYCQQFKAPNGTWRTQYMYKLSNDGFFYPEVSEMKTSAGPYTRHGNIPNWYLLKGIERAKFGAVFEFVESHFEKKYRFQMYFNRDASRIDLKFMDSNSADDIIVTFEPGHPEEDFEDEWTENA